MNADEYVKLAEVEDRLWYFHSLHGHVRRELENHVGRGPAKILDAGCGTGGLILRLREAETRWIWSGIDFMPLACELARQRCLGVEFQVASITDLPFPPNSFDALVSADVICQIDDPIQGVLEFTRVLRPGGWVIINVPAYRWMWSYHDDSCQTKHRFARHELRSVLARAGLDVVRLGHWNALPFPLIFAKRKLFRRAEDTSDVKPQPALIDWALRRAMSVEHAWMRTGRNWAWGTSLFAVARKPAA